MKTCTRCLCYRRGPEGGLGCGVGGTDRPGLSCIGRTGPVPGVGGGDGLVGVVGCAIV